MSSGLKKRMALLLACAITFTSVDSSILTASAMEVVEEPEHVHTEECEHENEDEAEILEEVQNFAGGVHNK